MSEGVRRIDIKEFQEVGFLQEANRLFFHPHGLALEVVVDDECEACGGRGHFGDGGPRCYDCDGSGKRPAHRVSRRLGGIWDYREDPEGIVFGLGGYGDSHERACRVAEERAKHAQVRARLFDDDDYPVAGHGLPLEGGDIEPLAWTFPQEAK